MPLQTRHELLTYSFCPQEMSDQELRETVEGLLQHLESKGVKAGQVMIGETNSESRALIDRVLRYWAGSGTETLPTAKFEECLQLIIRAHKDQLDIRTAVAESTLATSLSRDELLKVESWVDEVRSGGFEPLLFNSVLLTGDLYKLSPAYGVAIGDISTQGVCLNANLSPKSIWHETAHILGAIDHYGCGRSKCAQPGECIMGFDTLGFDFCETSLNEMRNTLKRASSGEA